MRLRRSTVPDAVRALKTELTVHHERQLVITPRDAAIGSQFTKRECEISDRIGRNREGFTHHCNAPRTTCGGHRVRVGKCGIGIDQSGHHHEVLRDTVRVLFAQRLQLSSRDAIEVLWLRVFRHCRIVMT